MDEQLTAGEINYVRTQWILSVQGEFYDKELDAVIQNDPNPPAYVKQFGLFLDDNRVLRCKGNSLSRKLPGGEGSGRGLYV